MRLGSNPTKYKGERPRWPAIMAVVVTHLPSRAGYHSARFPVIRACLESIRRNAGRKLPVMVWDNGSDAEFRSWLQDDYKPEYLVMTPNIGKEAARAAFYRMLPADTVVCFSDDDMLHYPGWLDAHLALLDGFPSVGAVSGWPVRVSFGWGNAATILWAKFNAVLDIGRFITDDEEIDYAESVGMDGKDWLRQGAGHCDIRVSYNGLTAYAEAQHCQFVAHAGVMAPLCDHNYDWKRGDRPFDEAIDRAGLLRLTTTKRYTRHMGNVIDPKLRRELEAMGL